MALTRRLLIAGLAGLQGCAVMGATVTQERPAFDPGDPHSAGIQLTRPDGTPIYLNPRAVAFVRAPLAGEKGNATIVFSNGHTQSVLETVDQVIHGITIEKDERGAKPKP